MTPDDFPKHFATLFAARDSAGLGDMLDQVAQVVTLTGGVAETREAAQSLFEQEFSGIFTAGRLVTGKGRVQLLGPGAVVLHQTYVVTGARGADGATMPRFPALVSAVLMDRPDGWRAVSLILSALT